MAIKVGIALFVHQAYAPNLASCARVIHRVAVEKRAPVSIYFTGVSLDAIRKHHPLLHAALRDNAAFAENAGALDPYRPELGISCSNYIPVVPLGLELPFWGHHLGMAYEQIKWAKENLWYNFGKNTRGFLPPELVMAPAGAGVIKDNWVSYTLFDGLHLNQSERGQIYHVDGLKFVPRNSDIYLYDGKSPWEVMDYTKGLARDHGISQVVIGGDLDAHLNGPISEHDWTRFLCQLSDALFEDGETELVNVASIADNYWNPRDLRDVYRDRGIWDPHHFTTSWIDASGVLALLEYGPSREVNNGANDFTRYYAHLGWRLGAVEHQLKTWRSHQNLWKWYNDTKGWLERVKHGWYPSAGMEYRHPGWVTRDNNWNNFWNTYNWTMDELRRIDSSLHGLEQHAFH